MTTEREAREAGLRAHADKMSDSVNSAVFAAMSDTKDLVWRLREWAGIPMSEGERMMIEAADTIERLTEERDALRADAERWRYFVTHCEWIRHWPQDAERDEPYSYMLLRLPYGTDQSSVATRNAAIDAARTGSKT